jgi:hypothetical protein
MSIKPTTKKDLKHYGERIVHNQKISTYIGLNSCIYVEIEDMETGEIIRDFILDIPYCVLFDRNGENLNTVYLK